MDYDFNKVKLDFDNTWEYFSVDGYIANDGILTYLGCSGAKIDSNPYNIYMPPSATPWADHFKWYVQTINELIIRQSDVIGVEWLTSVHTYRTGYSPFNSSYVEDEDLRLASAQFMASDLDVTGLNFGFIVTNDRVYGLYMKFPGVLTFDAWMFVMPLRARRSCDINKLRLEINSGCKKVTYMVDNEIAYCLNNVGLRLTNTNLKVQEFGGQDSLAFPKQLWFSFGTTSFLNWYPACKDIYCHNCHFPAIRMGLVDLGNATAPVACDPVLGCPTPASYLTDGSNPIYQIWGQGTIIEIGGFKVDRYNCLPL